MRYSLITLIIAVVWAATLIIGANFPDLAKSLFYITLFCTMAIFYIGFQTRTR